jgi:hypothetical protein
MSFPKWPSRKNTREKGSNINDTNKHDKNPISISSKNTTKPPFPDEPLHPSLGRSCLAGSNPRTHGPIFKWIIIRHKIPQNKHPNTPPPHSNSMGNMDIPRSTHSKPPRRRHTTNDGDGDGEGHTDGSGLDEG